jgi:predicted Zn-dependent protease
MAKQGPIPDPLARRHELEKALDPARARAIGEAYLAEKREIEAIAFLKKASANDVLEKLCAAAIERGDAFQLREACTALGRELERESWERLARAAERQGREKYAAEAKRQVERLGGRSS